MKRKINGGFFLKLQRNRGLFLRLQKIFLRCHPQKTAKIPDSTLKIRWKSQVNLKAMATTGRFEEDPPEVKAHFKKARERYLRAAEQYPGAYREMQRAFAQVGVLLEQGAAPGLTWYAHQTELNPDLIGQIFVSLLNPGPDWRQYLPAWGDALAAARAHYPDTEAGEVIDSALVEAALAAEWAGVDLVQLEPGVNFEAWFGAIEPYLIPVVIGPPAIDSGATMLALAARFPVWAVQRGLVRFEWTGVDPLLLQMAGINIAQYGLNGYTVELVQTGVEIEAELIRQAETQTGPSFDAPPPLPVEEDENEDEAEPHLSFRELFRHDGDTND